MHGTIKIVDRNQTARILLAPMKTLRNKLFSRTAGNELRINECATQLRRIRMPGTNWHTNSKFVTDEYIGLLEEAPMQ